MTLREQALEQLRESGDVLAQAPGFFRKIAEPYFATAKDGLRDERLERLLLGYLLVTGVTTPLAEAGLQPWHFVYPANATTYRKLLGGGTWQVPGQTACKLIAAFNTVSDDVEARRFREWRQEAEDTGEPVMLPAWPLTWIARGMAERLVNLWEARENMRKIQKLVR